MRGKQVEVVANSDFYELKTKQRETVTKIENVSVTIMAIVVIVSNEVKHRMAHLVPIMEVPT